MRRYFSFLIVLALLGTGGAVLHAQPARAKAQAFTKAPAGRAAWMRGRMRMMQKLNLTDVQQKQIENLRTAMQKQAVELRSKIQLDRIDLRELLRADEPNRPAIEKKLDDIASLQTKQKMLRIDHMFDVKKILTPEQQKIWKSEMKPMMFGRFGGRGMGMMRNNRGMMNCEGMKGMQQDPPGAPGEW